MAQTDGQYFILSQKEEMVLWTCFFLFLFEFY